MQEKLCIVYVTASSMEEAASIGKKLVSDKLAACSNVFDGMNSYYMWEGKMEEALEAVLILKTKASLFQQIEKAIKEVHSYSCPCIVSLPIENISKEYEEWILNNTK